MIRCSYIISLLAQTRQALPDVQLVIMRTFYFTVGMVKNAQLPCTVEVQKRQPIVKGMTDKYNAVIVPLQAAFNKAATKTPADHWIWDGIHPMPAGREHNATNGYKQLRNIITSAKSILNTY